MADAVVYRQRRKGKDDKVRMVSEILRRTPSHEELRSRLSYDPNTGVFTNLVNLGKAKIGAVAGSVNPNGYWEIRVCNRLFPAHRLAWFYMTGELPPDGMTIDHVNGVRCDNRWCNLRLATYEEQAWNSIAQSDCKSGMKGAWLCKSTGRWQAIIGHKGKRKFLGRFDTAEEAHQAYIKAAIELRGIEWTERSIALTEKETRREAA